MALPFVSKQLKRSEKIVMFTTLSWMLSSGVSAVSGVVELVNDPNNKMNKAGLVAMRDGLEEGKSLSEIFKDNEAIFGSGYWRQVDAAERTGKVPQCLQRMARQVQSDSDLMGKVRNAVIYPAVIMVFALLAGYYMFTTVVPQMADMLAEFNAELPALTVMVMAVSDFMMNHIILLGVLIFGTVFLIRWILRHPMQFKWHRFITKIPIIGQVSIDMNYSLVYTLLSDMIENGAHVFEALRVAAGSATNIYIRGELLAASDKMQREGVSLTEALVSTKTMPPDDKLMLQIGARTGRELELLESLSIRRHDAANDSVNSLMEIMPTLVLLVVAAVVAVMVIAIYMPMISMATDIV